MLFFMPETKEKTKKKKKKKRKTQENASDDEHLSSKHDRKDVATQISRISNIQNPEYHSQKATEENGSPIDQSEIDENAVDGNTSTSEEKKARKLSSQYAYSILTKKIKSNKNPSTSTLDEKNTRRIRCLRIWVAVMTILLLLFLFLSAVGGIFLVGSIETSMDDQQNSISALQNKQAWMITKDEQTQTGVFFTARINESLTVTGGQTVVYDHVITSLGGGYNASSGIFSAPKTGYYRAEINTQSQHRQESFLELQHNNISVFQVEGDKSTFIGGKDSASNSAIVRLKKGDQLRVVAKVAKASVNKIQIQIQLTNRYMNTFTVLLLYVE